MYLRRPRNPRPPLSTFTGGRKPSAIPLASHPTCSLIFVSDPKPDPTEDEQSEFDRFKDFARKLIAVPKREIDEQREKERKT